MVSGRASGFNLVSGAQVCLLSRPGLHAEEGAEGCDRGSLSQQQLVAVGEGSLRGRGN